MAKPRTNCIFVTFRVEESFWTKKQSCKFSKVDIRKWRPFFDFVCFNGRRILKLWYLSRGEGKYFFNFVFPNQYMAKINSHTKSQTGIVVILFSLFRVGVVRFPISTKLPKFLTIVRFFSRFLWKKWTLKIFLPYFTSPRLVRFFQ